MSTPASAIPPAQSTPHLDAAKEVVEYIRGLGIAASNRPADVARYGSSEVESRFQALDQEYVGALQVEGKERVKAIARAVERTRAGNCEDQANLAFDMLARRGVRPLELMALYNSHGHGYEAEVRAAITGAVETYSGPDHAFVVIGRVGGTITDPRTWNSTAVVCDPWAKRVYYAYWLEQEMMLLSRVSGDWTTTTSRFELRSGSW